MTRQTIVNVTLASIGCIALIFLAWQLMTKAHQATEFRCIKCNVILISFETLGPTHTSVYNDSLDTTPFLKQLADERSVVFENAYAQSPWTLPAYASMLTGTYPWETIPVWTLQRFPQSLTTIAERMQSNGYTTAAFSTGLFINTFYALDQGFTTFDASSKKTSDNTQPRDLPALFLRANKWITEHHDDNEPFFVFLRPLQTHQPYVNADGATVTPDEVTTTQGASNASNETEVTRIRDAYHEDIIHADAALREFLDSLEQAGVLQDTIIIITSDHGQEFGEHGILALSTKRLYREALWVPLLIMTPQKESMRIDAPIEIRSLTNTILDLIGQEVDTALGPSLRPLVLGTERGARHVWSQTLSTTPLLFSSEEEKKNGFRDALYPKDSTQFAESLIQGTWHIIKNADGTLEIYAWSNDPTEQQNLVPRLNTLAPEIQKEMRSLISTITLPH